MWIDYCQDLYAEQQNRIANLAGKRPHTGDYIILLRDLTAKMCNKCDLEGCDRWEVPDLNPRGVQLFDYCVGHSLSASLACMDTWVKIEAEL